jgi:hypothetical protein
MDNYQESLEKFHNYLFDIVKLHQAIIPYLKKEIDLIEADDIEGLNRNLNEQQRFSYQMKNFDTEILKYMNQLNVKGKNLSEVILHFPQEQQMRFFWILSQFETAVKEVQFYKEKCEVLLQTKLYLINKKITGVEGRNDNGTYQENGKEKSNVSFSKIFEKKI